MLFPNLSTLRYSFFREIILFMATLFSDREEQFPGFGNHISSTLDLHCSGFARWLYWWLLFIYSGNFWQLFGFLPSFFSSSNNNFYSFFLKLVISIYSSIFDVVTGKLWVCHWLNASKLLKWSTVITDHCRSWSTKEGTFTFYPSFQLPWALSCCKYKP